MPRINAVILRRSDEENTVALVSAECDPECITNAGDLFGAISEAVTHWAQQGDGKELLEANGGDINIGDLATECLGDAHLTAELARWGVTDLQVSCHVGDATFWDFDDNLYDDQLVEE